MNNQLHFTRETEVTQQMNDVLIDTFLHNPIFGINIFESNRHKLASLMRLCLLHYGSCGIIYPLRDSDNKIVALSLWSAPGSQPLDIATLLTRGFFVETVKNAIIIEHKPLKKLLHVTGNNAKHHTKEPHY